MMQDSLDYSSRFRILKGGKISLVVSALIASVTMLQGAPSGGVVTSGSASIAQSGSVTNITQSTQKAAINWQNFSIGSSETVNFKQPNASSVTLNRVVGNEKSIIDGALNANGQVFILNSNGVLFSKNARINTAGLVATTMNLSDADFMTGNYAFKGDSQASIINQGTITISDKGYAALFGKEVKNEGIIKATLGKVELVGAKEVTLNLNGNSLVSLKVDKGVLDALVENKGAIYADGGEVYLTTNAVGELLNGVVNNTGMIQANSLEDVTGKVELFAHGGTTNVSGTLEAKDGFIETSGESLHVSKDVSIKAKEWLLDPTNIIIADGGTDGIGGATMDADTVTAVLNGGTDVTLQADQDITVNENITWTTAKKLTLTAGDEIYVNATIKNTNTTNGGVFFNAANVHNKVIFGANGKVIIHNPYQLQWMNQALAGKYELGSDIDASVTSGWNGGAGWMPIGNAVNKFTGNFDGLGHTIEGLFINRLGTTHVGLFGYASTGTIQNVGVINADITGGFYVGGLVGYADSESIASSYFTGSVTGQYYYVGGLVGWANSGSITNSYASGSVTGQYYVGGLVGWANSASITSSYASGSVTGTGSVGGLVATSFEGTITNSYYDKEANTGTMGDSATHGKTKAELLALVTGGTWNNTTIWGYEGSQAKGYATDAISLPFLRSVTKFDNTLFNNGFGTALNPYTITNWTQLQNINYASDTTLLSKYYTLSNNLNSATAGYTNSGEGWMPIGNNTNKFTGKFDGLGHTITGLFINRSTTDNIGLFGYTNTGATIQNVGIINADITGNDGVGGLVGQATSTTITNSYTTGSVTGSLGVGGFVGVADSATITKSYASGKVTGTSNVGGLVGQATSSTVTSSFWDKETSGQTTSAGGGTGKTTAELQKFSTFKDAGWDIVEDSTLAIGTPVLTMNGGSPVWKIGTATVSSSPSAPAPSPSTPSLTPNISYIENGTAVMPPRLNMDTPRLFTTDSPSYINAEGQRVQLMSTPLLDMPTVMVSTQEVRAIQEVESGDLRVPMTQGSLIYLLNGGLNLPSGEEQEFFMLAIDKDR